MTKLSWGAFIAKYPGAGHVATAGTLSKRFKKPSGISSNNQKEYPTIPALLKEAVGASFSGDWAHTRETVSLKTTKNGKPVSGGTLTRHLFVFSNPADAVIAATYLGAGSTVTTNPPVPGFRSWIKGRDLDQQDYVQRITPLGY